jgi:hypothetical protein
MTANDKIKICKRCGYTRDDTIKEVRNDVKTARRCLLFQMIIGKGSCSNKECRNEYCPLYSKGKTGVK